MTTPKTPQEAADDLLGSCQSLSDVVECGEDSDQAFCEAVDALVMCCDCCGWWVETGDLDDQGNCSDCADEADYD